MQREDYLSVEEWKVWRKDLLLQKLQEIQIQESIKHLGGGTADETVQEIYGKNTSAC